MKSPYFWASTGETKDATLQEVNRSNSFHQDPSGGTSIKVLTQENSGLLTASAVVKTPCPISLLDGFRPCGAELEESLRRAVPQNSADGQRVLRTAADVRAGQRVPPRPTLLLGYLRRVPRLLLGFPPPSLVGYAFAGHQSSSVRDRQLRFPDSRPELQPQVFHLPAWHPAVGEGPVFHPHPPPPPPPPPEPL
ncbi:hypothetical protein CEXT_408291 [Caerostris extrusa]|uniref:Uncharacterized protein n=1 Tax=Caerostris extrusa TaxID=172846 RepID=A0AAV4SAH8_CAEEX|nr:hypothetical protein CEXT_408291 [Caerostris extrusa]